MEIEDNSANFGIVDYCVFGGMFIFTGVIGLYFSYKGNKSPEEFLMGNRSFNPLPVAMSLLTSYVSAISYLGVSGEIYAHGMQFAIFIVGAILAVIFASHFVLPILFPLNLTSINEYIELRFKSKRLRTIISILNTVKSLIYMGVLLYAPTIALVTVTKVSILTYIFLLGIICTLYSAFGGIRAVIWTDVFQLTVMLIGGAVVVVVGCVQLGGFFDIFYVASKGGRLDMFDMNPSPFVRNTFFNCLSFGFFVYGTTYCSEQINVQRMCAVKTIKDARIMFRYIICGIVLIYFLIFTGGLVAYATYVGCDPMALGIIRTKEEIMTYYVGDKLSFVPGLSGIFVATLIGGTLSSLSSMINACVAMVWKDVCLRFLFFKNASTRRATITNQILSLVIGSLIIGMAIVASKAHSLIEFSTTILMPLNGPVFGIFTLAYFFPKCNLKGVWAGFIFSSIISVWMSLGGLIYKEIPEMLPFSAENCSSSNLTWANVNVTQNFSLNSGNITEINSTNGSFLMAFYHVSYTLYSFIGPFLVIVAAIIVSFVTGNQKIEDVSPKYICPSIHKFYWKKEKLEELLGQGIKLEVYNINVNKDDQGDHEAMINTDTAMQN